MSSTNPPDRTIRVLAAVAIVAAFIGGSLYFSTVFAPDPEPHGTGLPDVETSRGAARVPSATSPAAATRDADETDTTTAEPRTLGGVQPIVLPGARDLQTRPIVEPASQRAAAEQTMSRLLPQLETCWKMFEGEEPTRSARLLVSFTAGPDGETTDIDVTARRLGEPAIAACGSDKVKALSTDLEPGTRVFWPVELDRRDGAKL